MVKRLVIKASNSYTGEFQTVPINALEPVKIILDIGTFELLINIKNFDGSNFHRANSLYNLGASKYLNGEAATDKDSKDVDVDKVPNLSFEVNFNPKESFNGKDLIFGNDFTTPIKDYVPTTLLAAGLKFFNWFINSTVKGDIYNEKPFLYGPVLNSCTYMSINDPIPFKYSATDTSNTKYDENLNDNVDNLLKIPSLSLDRKRFFNKLSTCENFVFVDSSVYKLKFDTNFIKMSDSKYSVSLPTYNRNTFDIDVLSFANEKLNNFNWVIKYGGYEGVNHGRVGLVVNFALVDEQDTA